MTRRKGINRTLEVPYRLGQAGVAAAADALQARQARAEAAGARPPPVAPVIAYHVIL